MTEIRHALKVKAGRPQILQALTQRAALERWHGAKVDGGPEEWTIRYDDGSVFRWKVLRATPEQVVWRCEEGPGQAKGSEVTFTLQDVEGARTQIHLVHCGWDESDEKLATCNTLWAVLLGRLQHEAEGFELKKR